jgi:nucleotide-binding universal stress UspA family protein
MYKPRSVGYRAIVVPVADNPETDQALDVACRLAADHGCSLTAVAVVEVPTVLPVDAHMDEEEAQAKTLLRRAETAGDSYGIQVSRELVRAREAATAIVEQADAHDAEVIVLGAPRHRRRAFGHTTDSVLRGASCRVMVIAGSAPAANGRTGHSRYDGR